MTDLSVLVEEPDATYRAAPGLNWSLLKVLELSPLHFRWRRSNPRPDSPSLSLGRAAHAAILQPEVYAEGWAVYEGRRAGKAWAAFQEEHAEREIITSREAETVTAMAAAVRRHPFVARLLDLGGVAERSIYWTGGERAFKARADLVVVDEGRVTLVDLKTSRDMAPDAFGRSAVRYGYHGQLAHYATGLEAVLGVEVDCCIIAVESDQPHDAAVYHLGPLQMAAGRRLRSDLLARLAACEASGEWPGQAPFPMPLQLPEWALADIDADFTFED